MDNKIINSLYNDILDLKNKSNLINQFLCTYKLVKDISEINDIFWSAEFETNCKNIIQKYKNEIEKLEFLLNYCESKKI